MNLNRILRNDKKDLKMRRNWFSSSLKLFYFIIISTSQKQLNYYDRLKRKGAGVSFDQKVCDVINERPPRRHRHHVDSHFGLLHPHHLLVGVAAERESLVATKVLAANLKEMLQTKFFSSFIGWKGKIQFLVDVPVFYFLSYDLLLFNLTDITLITLDSGCVEWITR